MAEPVLVQSPSHLPEPKEWSVFTRRQKILIIALVSFGGFFSPTSAAIYFPAIQTLANDFHKSTTLINFTITTYMVLQGIAPTVLGDLAESLGKRPVYLISFAIYIAANVGLACQSNYAALLVLRAMQSCGSSATIALGISTAGDIAKGSERGRYVGWTSSLFLIGPAIGPILGGLLAGSLSWRAIFWFLAILAVVFTVLYALFCPETARSIVDDGSKVPPRLNQTGLELLRRRRIRREGREGLRDMEKNDEAQRRDRASRPTLRWPNPLNSLVLLKEKDIAIVLVYTALLFASTYQLLASLVSIFKEKYGYNDIQLGLCYIPYGVGTMISSYLGGRLLDWNLLRIAKHLDFDVNRRDESEEALAFPWELARLQVIAPFSIFGAICFLYYGWVLQESRNVPGQLIIQFLIGLSLNTATNAFSVMLVDCYPMRSATANAANNFTRCLLGAGATAAIEPMLTAMGRGPCFTFIGGVILLFSPLMWLLSKKGPQWRKERFQRA